MEIESAEKHNYVCVEEEVEKLKIKIQLFREILDKLKINENDMNEKRMRLW